MNVFERQRVFDLETYRWDDPKMLYRQYCQSRGYTRAYQANVALLGEGREDGYMTGAGLELRDMLLVLWNTRGDERRL